MSVHDSLDPSSCHGQSFGFVALIKADIFETMKKSSDKLGFIAEVYHDRDELALICSGRTEVSLTQPLRLLSRFSTGLSSQKFINIATTGDFSIPMFHKAQNKHQISAGQIDMSIGIYEINLKCILDPSLTISTSNEVTDVRNTQEQSIIVEIPAPIVPVSPIASVESLQQNDEVDVNTTKEDIDIDYLEDDYDPIDDFVSEFLSNRNVTAPAATTETTTSISYQRLTSDNTTHSRPFTGVISRIRFSGENSATRQSASVTTSQRKTTAGQRRPAPSPAKSSNRKASNYGRGLSMF